MNSKNPVGYFRVIGTADPSQELNPESGTCIHSLRCIISEMDFVTAFVVAGGKSSRMGTDKAFLELAGKPLVTYALDLARSVTSDARIAGDPEKFAAFAPGVQDIYPDRGPLGGIHAALASTSTDWNLVLGVDMPFLEARFLRYLITEAESSHAVVTVPSANGGLQPLCAVYRKEFSAAAEQSLSQGKNKIDALFSEVSHRIISEQEMIDSGFSPHQFRNLNTPEDWDEAQKLIMSKPPRN